MAALHWLFQLLGIAQKNERARRLGNRQHVRKRHLSCFVHDEDIHRFKCFLPSTITTQFPQRLGKSFRASGKNILIVFGKY